MNKTEIDKYLGQVVTLIDIDNDKFIGVLGEIKDHKIVKTGELVAVKNGYIVQSLKPFENSYTCYKSYIKKIIKGVMSNE